MNNKPVYFCHQCKLIGKSISDFLFIEEDINRSFCSDKCIEEFFSPLVNYYDSEEKKYRSEKDKSEKHLIPFLSDDEKIDNLLNSPDEIYYQENDFGEKLYSLIKNFKLNENESFSMIALCFIYANKPSFILFMTATQDEEILKKFTSGKKTEMKISQEEKGNIIEIDAETLSILENKKSNYLADMLDSRSPADVPFESFHLYDECLDHTMQNPDEIFKSTDSEGDDIYTYIKAHVRDTITFYYFVICFAFKGDKNPKNETLIPILSFPTLDGELYQRYKKGEVIQGMLKN